MTKKILTLLVVALFIVTTAFTQSPFAGGTGTALDPYQISTARQLDSVRYFLNKSFILMNDIDLTQYLIDNEDNGKGWIPIGTLELTPFSGNFRGIGHTIIGLWINRTTQNGVGLFGCISGATIDSMSVEIAVAGVIGQDYVGGLVGFKNNSVIPHCYVTGNVKGNNNVGGLVGVNNNSPINNCYATGNIEGNSYVGGLVGANDQSTFTNCYATGIVNGYEDSEYIGGLVGNNSSSVITNCYATGDVSGNEHVGGLLGLNVYGSVINCYAVGNVIGIGSSIGGLVGTNSVNSTITNCYFDILTTGQANGIGFNTGGTVSVAGKNTEEMKQQSTFEDWDFEDIWTICTFGNNGYPYLQWQDIDCTPNSIETIINDELQIMVYPNPVKDELRIESGEVKIINIKIIDLTGKTYVNCQLLTNSIDVSFLSSGIYFVKLETEKGSVTKKIIKE